MNPATATPTRPTAGQRLTGLFATVAVLGIIIGLPVLFLALGANPVPDQAPTWESIRDALLAPDDGTLILGLFKVIGWAAREGRLPLTGHVLAVSSRASFELVQKAAVAGAPVLAAVSAASTLAVQTAEELGVTLVGFLRPPRLTLYSRPGRILLA